MFRRMILPIFGGALLAVVFTFAQTGKAACDDRCPEKNGKGDFDSCLITFTCPSNGSCYESGHLCFYTDGGTIID